MANLQNDSAVGARSRRPLPVRYASDTTRHRRAGQVPA
jgi:hypothetical protein